MLSGGGGDEFDQKEVWKDAGSYLPIIQHHYEVCVFSFMIFGTLWKDLGHPVHQGKKGMSLTTKKPRKMLNCTGTSYCIPSKYTCPLV